MLSQDMLRKYITYAKANCRPKLQNADYEKITQVSRRYVNCGPTAAQAADFRKLIRHVSNEQMSGAPNSTGVPRCRTQTMKESCRLIADLRGQFCSVQKSPRCKQQRCVHSAFRRGVEALPCWFNCAGCGLHEPHSMAHGSWGKPASL